MDNLDRLRIFIRVAQTGSFTKSASQLGISQSTLSYSLKMLEQELGVKLINRTTRSIATTAAGEKLLQEVAPLLDDIETKVSQLQEFCRSPRGTIRLTGSNWAFQYVVWEKLRRFRQQFPEISLEINADVRFQDIIKQRFDAGIRLGELVDKDMVAVRISPDVNMCVVGSPNYLAKQGIPQSAADLAQFDCLAMRLPSLENLMTWELCEPVSKKVVRHAPNEHFICNDNALLIQAVCDGDGLAWLPEFVVADYIARRELVEVLADWALVYRGYHLYYPSRRTDSPAFRALVECLRE